MVRARKRAALTALLLLLTSCTQPSAPPPDPFSKKVIYIGVTTDHPGWSTHEQGTNRRTGFDIALARWLESRLGKPVTFVDLTLAERMGALEDHKVDLVISTLSITDKRRETIDFAGPYMITRQGVMVREDDDSIKTYDDLTGKNICVADGTTSQTRLELEAKSLLTDETALKDCVQRLIDKQVDAFSTDELVLYGFAQDTPGTRVVDGLTFGAEEQYGIGLPNDDKRKCDLLTKHLTAFLNEGAWEDFLERNLGPEDLNMHKPLKLDPCENSSASPAAQAS